MVLITRWNMMLCEYSWPLCTVRFCSHLIFYVLYMFEGRENDESILNSDTGISSDSAHSLTLVLCLFVFLFSKRKPCWFFFFLNVIATKMYIFKNCESVQWCSLEIKKKKLYRFNQLCQFILCMRCKVIYI